MFRIKTKIFRVIVTSFLIISLLLGFFIANKCFSIDKPGDSPENPIVINSIKDLETFAQDLDEGNSYSNKFVELNNDISINKNNKVFSKNFKKHGTLFVGTFDGVFNGNNYTIDVNIKDKSKKSDTLLFKSLGKKAKIKNLKSNFSFNH